MIVLVSQASASDFVSGATALGCFAIALFFARFWRQSADRFFALFALAFAVFGANRVVLALVSDDSEARTWIYLLRFLAFVLILLAVADKNRKRA